MPGTRSDRASAKVELAFKNARMASAVWSSLKPEEGLPGSARCKVDIRRRKNILCLGIDADDTAALRAALNSFLRWAAVARDVIERRGE